MRLEQSITQEVYDKKANELMSEQEELQNRRDNYFNATINYGKVVTDLVSITSRAWQIFESSSIDCLELYCRW